MSPFPWNLTVELGVRLRCGLVSLSFVGWVDQCLTLLRLVTQWQATERFDPYGWSADNIHLAKFCQKTYSCPMSTMNISLPEALKSFVDAQVSQGSYGTSSEYVRELIRKEQDRLHLRGLLLAGAASPPAVPADSTYFEGLRGQVRKSGRSGASE